MKRVRTTASGLAASGRTAAMRLAVVGAVSMLTASAATAQQLEKPIEERVKANESGADSQKRVEEIASATDGLIGEYRLTMKKIESLDIFNTQLRAVVDSQNEELASLQRQIDGINEVSRAVTPLMLKMIDALDKFIDLDVPFDVADRKDRVNKLRVLMRRSDVADPERYRAILEAYQIENDYGRTIEAKSGTVERNGIVVPVTFLRVGRLALMYKTDDASEIGFWNKENGAFEPLDSSFQGWVTQAIRVAKKQAAPELIKVPLPQPEKATGGQG